MKETFITTSSNPDKQNMDVTCLETYNINLTSLSQSLSKTLGIDFIVYNHHLAVLYHTTPSCFLLETDLPLDFSLASRTEPRFDWKSLLLEVLGQNRILRFDAVRYAVGKTIRLLNILCMPVQGDRGQVALGAIAIEDVTDKLLRENAIIQAERLISIGKVAGKVAHELNNPIDGILRYINLAIRVLEQGNSDKTRSYLQQSRTGLLRMVTIISELLEFSRGTHQIAEPLALDKIIEDALDAMRTALAGIEVQVVRRYEGQAMQIRNDRMFQVFSNLIKNAADAMQGQGTLTITLERETNSWLIHFQDSGPGIASDVREDIFKPFFTTKEAGRGTGLGLAICKDLVEKHNGSISVYCPPEGGSVFSVRLPDTKILSTNSQ